MRKGGSIPTPSTTFISGAMMNTRRDEARPWRVMPGPWDQEPDWAELDHAGLPCLLMRNGAGAWCGYVHVPPYHPCWREAADDGDGHYYWPFVVHGGITWVGGRDFSDGRRLTTIGFDTNHFGDRAPERFRPTDPITGYYRNFEYAVAEVKSLAEQVTAYKPLEQMSNIFSGAAKED